MSNRHHLGDKRLLRTAEVDDNVHMGDRWGASGPPEEAYGRVTDPSRYAELHVIGHDLLDDLERRYDVTRATSVVADRHSTTAAPVVRLVPVDPRSSTLGIGFDAFPGLTVYSGRAGEFHLPACGCDACDETVAECAERLQEHVEAIIAGTFGEALVHADGAWWHEHWSTTAHSESRGRSRLDREHLSALRVALDGGSRGWQPWQERSVGER